MRAGNLAKFGGSAYENLDDCFADLDGALDFLTGRQYKRFVLVGHSLGAIKSIIYQGTRRRSDIAGVVSCSAPKQFYSERIERQPKFRELIDQAESMVATGRGEELMLVPVGATPGIFSARTHLDKYGKDDRNDCRPYARSLGSPLLAIAGGAEPQFFHDYATELVANAGANATYESIDGGNHFYHRHTRETVELMDRWFSRLPARQDGRKRRVP